MHNQADQMGQDSSNMIVPNGKRNEEEAKKREAEIIDRDICSCLLFVFEEDPDK